MSASDPPRTPARFAPHPAVVQSLTWGWAAPATLLGLLVGGCGLASGGCAQRVGPTLEFHGGAVRWLLRHLARNASAMTLGHVILGSSRECLDLAREHEWVHVRQYERWGPLFIPAYFVCGAWQWLRGRHPYWDNPFEREAYDVCANHRATAVEPPG